MQELILIIPHFFRCVPRIFLLIAILGLGACQDPDVVVPTMDDIRSEQLPDQESWFTQFDVIEGDHPRLQIQADYIAKYERKDSTYMRLEGHPDSTEHRVVAFLFDEVGDSSATIFSERMVYFEEDQRFEAHGEVVVLTREKKRLETEFLIWLEKERKVYTDGFVRITTPTEKIQGYDLEADEDLTDYVIARVTGQGVVDDL